MKYTFAKSSNGSPYCKDKKKPSFILTITSDEVSYFNKDPEGVSTDNVSHRVSGKVQDQGNADAPSCYEERGVWK